MDRQTSRKTTNRGAEMKLEDGLVKFDEYLAALGVVSKFLTLNPDLIDTIIDSLIELKNQPKQQIKE